MKLNTKENWKATNRGWKVAYSYSNEFQIKCFDAMIFIIYFNPEFRQWINLNRNIVWLYRFSLTMLRGFPLAMVCVTNDLLWNLSFWTLLNLGRETEVSDKDFLFNIICICLKPR